MDIAAAQSRFAGLGRWPARLLLLLLLLLTLHGLAQAPAPVPASTGNAEADRADVALYERVIEGVRAGGDYHEVAAAEHRAGGYPLRPFVTVRLPTLAWVQAALPRAGSAALLYLLLAATLALWLRRLSASGMPQRRALIGAGLLLAGAATLLLPDLLVWHESWAALLIALALSARCDGRYRLALGAGLAAVLIREHALLLPLVMAALALKERRVGETIAWGAIILLFGLYLGWHAGEVARVTSEADPASPGWGAAHGWAGAVTMVHLTGPLRTLPYWTAAMLVPVALLGWAGWRNQAGQRAAALLGAYLLLFALAGRLDNFYWGFLVAPLVPLGLLFAPAALADLVRSARGPEPRPALST